MKDGEVGHDLDRAVTCSCSFCTTQMPLAIGMSWRKRAEIQFFSDHQVMYSVVGLLPSTGDIFSRFTCSDGAPFSIYAKSSCRLVDALV